MKRTLICSILLSFCSILYGQIKWDGGGDGFSWNDPANWLPDAVPSASANVVLDNSIVVSNYIVNLGPTTVTASVNTLFIIPGATNTIQLSIPATNTANPGLSVTGMGDALILDSGAVLLNSTGAAGGGLGLAITNAFRINNGGKYIHNNTRGNAGIVSQLSIAVGTERGIFEFDVPGSSGYAVSLSGRTFGTLVFSANASGIPRTYTGNGTSNLSIRGDLVVNPNTTLSSTMTANIVIGGNLSVSGVFDNSPSSAGSVNRSILFNGTTSQTINGAGNIGFGSNFRNLEVNAGATVSLQRNVNLSNANQTLIIDSGGALLAGTNIIAGNGRFQLNPFATLGIGSGDGITGSPIASGNVQTANRSFASSANYEYNGASPQVTGDGLPTVLTGRLKINNAAGISSLGVTLSNTLMITGMAGVLDLSKGKLRTSSPAIIHIGPDASIENYSANSFVGGPLKVTGHSSFLFPIGLNAASAPTGTIYAPVTMSDTTANNLPTDSYTAEYMRGNPSDAIGPVIGDSINHISYVEYWRILRTDSGSNPFTKQLTLQVNPESFCHKIDSTLVARFDSLSSQWKSEGRSDYYRDPLSTSPLEWGRISSESRITRLGYFTLATTLPFAGNPLPIRLLAFDAIAFNDSAAIINWELGEDCAPNTKFEIQVATKNIPFSTKAMVPAAVNERRYQYTDNELRPGINFYRLRIIENNQRDSFSRTVAVAGGRQRLAILAMSQVPVSDHVSITISSSRELQFDLLIIDMMGRIVRKKNVALYQDNSSIDMSLEGLATGIYQMIGINAFGEKTNAIRFIR